MTWPSRRLFVKGIKPSKGKFDSRNYISGNAILLLTLWTTIIAMDSVRRLAPLLLHLRLDNS